MVGGRVECAYYADRSKGRPAFLDFDRPGELAVQDSGTIGDTDFRQRLGEQVNVDNLLAKGVRRARQGAG